MIKNLLICTDGSPYGDTACAYALFFAKRLHCRLRALHVLDSRMLEGPLMADLSGWLGAQPYGAQLESFRQLMQEKGQAVIEAVVERGRAEGVEVETLVKMGHPAAVILEEEGRTELLVLGREGVHAEWLGDSMGSVAERVFRSAATPCLITPKTFAPISCMLAAYDGSGHASQALQQAAELAAALSIELVVLTVAEDAADSQAAEKTLADGIALCTAHQAQATGVMAEGAAEEQILKTAAERSCGLLVLGAYGHSRIREMILGSTTTYVAAHAEQPVLVVR